MQVFRPYIDHGRSAGFLDDLRLGKQRVEAKQVILAILRRLAFSGMAGLAGLITQ